MSPTNSTYMFTTTEQTTTEESDDDVIENQTRFYIIIITSFFLFFFSIVGYVFYNQWKRIRAQNLEKSKASAIQKEGKPMLSRKESVIGQGQKVVVIERRLSRMRRSTPEEEDVDTEKKISTISAPPCLSNDTAKTFYKLRSDHPNQPVMMRYSNSIPSNFIKDIGDFNSISEADHMNRNTMLSPLHSHHGMFSPPCGLYKPIKIPFSNCNAMRIHALQNDGFAPSIHGSPHISCETFPGTLNHTQNENCQIKYQHVHLDDKSSSTEASDHYQFHNDFCKSICNCNQILTVNKPQDENLLTVKQNIKPNAKPLRKTSATQTSIQDLNIEVHYNNQMLDDNDADMTHHGIVSSGREPLI